MPEVVPGLASTLWELGEHAKEDCVRLADALPDTLASAVIFQRTAKGRPDGNDYRPAAAAPDPG